MPLAEWQTFYVIVGSSAAALTGLMFVVVALLADFHAVKTTGRQIDAFGTPTVVHFGAVLLQSAIMTAPWPTLRDARFAAGVFGLSALIYTLIVVRRAMRQTDYQPVFEDWLFHSVLPVVAYSAILAAAVVVSGFRVWPLFVIGGATVLLLFVGIHNAWDTVTFIVLSQLDKRDSDAGSGVADKSAE